MALQETSESDIQTVILDYLAIKRYFFWRSNNTPIYDKVRKAHRALPKYAKHGLPDIIIVRDGRFIGLEVKRRRTYQSAEQRQFEADCRRAGGAYHVVRSIDDVINLGF